MNRICFTSCANGPFIEGLKGLIKSIRKFYGPEEADIVAFVEDRDDYVAAFCRAQAVELHTFGEINEWRRPLLSSARFQGDAKHYYHERFQVVPELPHHVDRVSLGVENVHHLHPLNVKAHCTAYCACILNAERIVHVDSDAFLLARVDELFERHEQRDTVIGFDDGSEALEHLEVLYGVSRPASFDSNHYAINAGIVFYVNGPGVKDLLTDFSFYVDSCYHYTYSGNFADQGVLRALIAKHHILGNIHFAKEEGVNWNPTWFRADRLVLDADRQRWINEANGRDQIIWHGAGGEKLWSGRYGSPSVNAAWRWVGGALEPLAYEHVKGSLIKPHCELICLAIAQHFHGERKVIRILEIGTQYARTAIAFCVILKTYGVECHVDTFDIYAPSPDYPAEHATEAEARQNIESFGLEDRIALHTVEGFEDIAPFITQPVDVAFIDGDHRYKQVIADCVVANKLVDEGGLILGDDLQLQSVRNAVHTVFGRDRVTELNSSMWAVAKVGKVPIPIGRKEFANGPQ